MKPTKRNSGRKFSRKGAGERATSRLVDILEVGVGKTLPNSRSASRGRLISVTSFFRNPEVFDILKRKVFPKVLQQRGNDPIRVWVLGCSTGQEAYSIAMAFVEAADNFDRARKLQVFATDLNDALLDKARHGLYARSLVQDLSPERLRRFFVEEEGGYRVAKTLREMVVFARQNLIGDPPFSRMDLISCRNLLIYLEADLQKKALPTFHYALKPGGFLLLDARKPLDRLTQLFEPVDKRHNIYSRKAVLYSTVKGDSGEKLRRGWNSCRPTCNDQVEQPEGLRDEIDAQRAADRITVNRFAPPGVLVNGELQIVQFRGPTSAYLQPPAGKASFDLLKMTPDGLLLPLRAAINKARKEDRTVRKEGLRVQQDGGSRTVNVQVIPLKNLRKRYFLILFEDAEAAASPGQGSRRAAIESQAQEEISARRQPHPKVKEQTRRVADLESELTEAREYLQSTQEQHEAANEQLQAANEELQSANEELQSIGEELENSNEELEQRVEERTKELDGATKRLQGLARQLIRSVEEERRSIALDLHDEIGQQLTGLNLLLIQAGAVPGNERKVCRQSAAIVTEIQRKIRTLLFILRESVPDHITIQTALECHFKQLEERAKLTVHFECKNVTENYLEPEIRHTLFRVAQEALTNILRHANVREAKVSLTQFNSEISIEISDRGTGFDVEAARGKLSCGISGMEERVLLFGGRFVLTSHIGEGTRIRVTLPFSLAE